MKKYAVFPLSFTQTQAKISDNFYIGCSMPKQEAPPVLQQYVKLSAKGQLQHRKLYISTAQTFFFWSFVGCCTGFTLTKLIPALGSNLPMAKMQRYKRYGFWVPIITFCYHGYKTSRRYKRRGLRQIVKDPQNIIKE